MGCNQSKHSDIQKSQEPRTRQSVSCGKDQKASSSSISNSVPISPTSEKGKEFSSTFQLGTSVTDKREAERDYFQNIIAVTQSNFIDVSSAVIPLGGHDAATRSKDYSKYLNDWASFVQKSQLHAIPNSSIHSSDPIITNLLSTNTIGQNEREFVIQCCATLRASFLSMKVVDCGELVVSFPEVKVQ